MEKPKRKCRATRGTRRQNKLTMEFTDWVKGDFAKTDTGPAKYTQSSKDMELCTYREKKGKCDQIRKRTYWDHHSDTREMGNAETSKRTKKLQQAADRNDMRPIWGFRRKLRMGGSENSLSIKKLGGAECK